MRRFKTMHIINLTFLYVNFFFMVFFILNLIECFVFYFSGCGRKKIALYGIKPDSIVDLIKIQEFHSACRDALYLNTSQGYLYHRRKESGDQIRRLPQPIKRKRSFSLSEGGSVSYHLKYFIHANRRRVSR